MYIQFDYYLYIVMYNFVLYSCFIFFVVRLLFRFLLLLDFCWMYVCFIVIVLWGVVFFVWMCCLQVFELIQLEFCELVWERLGFVEYLGDFCLLFFLGLWIENFKEFLDVFRLIYVFVWWVGFGGVFGWLFLVRIIKLLQGLLMEWW